MYRLIVLEPVEYMVKQMKEHMDDRSLVTSRQVAVAIHISIILNIVIRMDVQVAISIMLLMVTTATMVRVIMGMVVVIQSRPASDTISRCVAAASYGGHVNQRSINQTL